MRSNLEGQPTIEVKHLNLSYLMHAVQENLLSTILERNSKASMVQLEEGERSGMPGHKYHNSLEK